MDPSTILVFGASITGLMGATWLVATMVLAHQRASTLWWAVSNFSLCVTLTVTAVAGNWNGGELGHALSMIVLASILCIRLGLRNFVGMGLALPEHVTVLVLVVGGIWTLPDSQRASVVHLMTAAMITAAAAYLLFRAAAETRDKLQAECGRWLTAAVTGPLMLMGILYGLRTLNLLAYHVLMEFDAVRFAFRATLFVVLVIVVLVPMNMAMFMAVIGRLMSEIQRMSLQDHLTGLGNRRQMENALEAELVRARRTGRRFSVLIVDIDHFKRFNDRYGHVCGDEVLIRVAQTLRRTARQIDVVTRLGGEEFCVVLSETGIDGARRAAERMRQAVENEQVSLSGQPVSVTVSIGAAGVLDMKLPWLDVLQRADMALYRAKELGRNRVEVDTSTTPVVVCGESSITRMQAASPDERRTS